MGGVEGGGPTIRNVDLNTFLPLKILSVAANRAGEARTCVAATSKRTTMIAAPPPHTHTHTPRILNTVVPCFFLPRRLDVCFSPHNTQVKLTYDQRKERVAAKKDEIRAARLAEEE